MDEKLKAYNKLFIFQLELTKRQLEIRRAFIYISLYPESLQCRYETVRIFWTNKFPFGLYYIFDDYEVFVLAFWHEKEDTANKVLSIL